MWHIPDEAVWWNVELIIVSVCPYMYLPQSGLFFFIFYSVLFYFFAFYVMFLFWPILFCGFFAVYVCFSLYIYYPGQKNLTAEKFMRLIYSLIMWYREISSFGLISTRHGASDSVRRELSLQIEVDVAWLHCGSVNLMNNSAVTICSARVVHILFFFFFMGGGACPLLKKGEKSWKRRYNYNSTCLCVSVCLSGNVSQCGNKTTTMFHQTTSSGMWHIPDEAVWWNVKLIIVSVCLYVYLSQSGLFFILFCFILFFLHFKSYVFCFGLSSSVVSLQNVCFLLYIYISFFFFLFFGGGGEGRV